MVSPVSSAPRPSAPAGQCSTAAPSKWPPIRASVTPGTGSTLVVEQLDPRRRPLDPLLVGARDEHAGVERVGELDVGGVEVRVRHGRSRRCRRARAIRARAASSSSGTQSHSTLPCGVRTSRARWPIANGRVDADAEQAGLLLAQLGCAWSRGELGHAWSSCWPSQPTYCRSSSQIGQPSGGCAVSGCCTAQVTQIQAGIPRFWHGPRHRPHARTCAAAGALHLAYTLLVSPTLILRLAQIMPKSPHHPHISGILIAGPHVAGGPPSADVDRSRSGQYVR